MASRARHIKGVLGSRRNLVELGLTAAVLGLGINVLSNYLCTVVIVDSGYQVLAATVAMALSGAYFASIVLRRRSKSLSLNVLVPYDRDSNTVLDMPDYPIVSELSDTLQAVFAENKAFERMWKSEPLLQPSRVKVSDDFLSDKGLIQPKSELAPGTHERHEPDIVKYVAVYKTHLDKSSDAEPQSAQLLREAIEYCVIRFLSTHLADFFGRHQQSRNQAKEYAVRDMPDVLLQNRFIALLSTPISEREIFHRCGFAEHDEQKGELVMLRGSDGVKFDKIRLTLPVGTIARRPRLGTIEIENNRLKISICIDYNGHQAVFPRGFERLYFGSTHKQIDPLRVKIAVQITVNRLALLYPHRWVLQGWTDSVVVHFGRYASYKGFLKRISWPQIEMQTRIASRLFKYRKSVISSSAHAQTSVSSPLGDACKSPSQDTIASQAQSLVPGKSRRKGKPQTPS